MPNFDFSVFKIYVKKCSNNELSYNVVGLAAAAPQTAGEFDNIFGVGSGIEYNH